MLEKYLIDVLTTKFGQYFSNLQDSDKLYLSAWNGEVSLSNLSLNPDAIASKLFQGLENHPVQILYGSIGHLELHIPWRNFRRNLFWQSSPLPQSSSKSSTAKIFTFHDDDSDNKTTETKSYESNEFCSIILSDVNILLSSPPVDSPEYKASTLKAAKEQEVRRLLASLLRQTLSQNEDEDVTVVPRYWKWVKQFATAIISTLKITVKNVHIRYENPGDNFVSVLKKNAGFAIGISLHQFIVETVDKSFSFSDTESKSNNENNSNKQCNYKIASVDQLAIYWDSHSKDDLMSMVWKNLEENRQNTKKVRRPKRQRNIEDDRKSIDVSTMMKTAYSFTEKNDFFAHVFESMYCFSSESTPKEPHGGSIQLHTYVLQPISPVLHFNINSDYQHISNPKPTKLDNDPIPQTPPPSIEAKITIPFCKFVVHKNLLEDAAYLRKAMAHMNSAVDDLDEEHILHLATLRPKTRPDETPQLWWKYSYYAIRTMLEQDVSYRRRDRVSWKGLVKLLRLRRQYITLYRNFIESKEPEKNPELLELENRLNCQEIAAFRAYIYVKMNQKHEFSDATIPQSSGFMHSSLEYYKRETIVLSEIAAASERVSKLKSAEIESPVHPEWIKWKVTATFVNFKVEASDNASPIAILSCSAIQKVVLKHGGSWIIDFTTANLQVTDLITKGQPKLLSKKVVDNKFHSVSFVEVENLRLPHSASIFIENEISQTCLRVRLSPLQAIYSTSSFYSLHGLYTAAKTPEFSSDYEKLKAALSQWKSRQSAKIRKALTEKRRILTEINIVSPVFFIPEVERTLIVDLGQLTFSNIHVSTVKDEEQWKMALCNIQVLSSQSSYDRYQTQPFSKNDYALVEPFSFEFLITTQFSKNKNEICIDSVLPRLVFNLTTSAIRSIEMLGQKWDARKKKMLIVSNERDKKSNPNKSLSGDTTSSTQTSQNKDIDMFSSYKVKFSIPFVALHLRNDIDGRDSFDGHSTELVQLTIENINGNYFKTSETSFSVNLGSLFAMDLYQKAGKDYEMLLSSNKNRNKHVDLVSLDYTRYSEKESGSKLSIVFNELFVEWNPETIAAIQKALRSNNYINANDGSGKVLDSTDTNNSQTLLYPRLKTNDFHLESHTEEVLPNIESRLQNDITNSLTHQQKETLHSGGIDQSHESPKDISTPPFQLSFSISKFCLNLNKEARKRRLVSTQMVQLKAQYVTKKFGGIRIKASIGNLMIQDNGTYGGTLYSQMIGLKMIQEQKSLVYLEYESYPLRHQSDQSDKLSDCLGAKIDHDSGQISGSDASLSLHFSSMRFVFIQQFWLEIFDYFFEGILGYEVWGLDRPPADPPISEIASNLNIIPTEKINFLNFVVDMNTPTILLPVSYRSPHHIKLEVANLKFSNSFSGEPANLSRFIQIQWFNHCTIAFTDLRFFNWLNKPLSSQKIQITINVKWPVGPTAPLIFPKWRVKILIKEAAFMMQQSDYALFNHFLFYNIMEETRNLDEWNICKRKCMNEMVNYPYDFKDYPPTTYYIRFEIENILFHLYDVETGICDIKCGNLKWNINKLSDQIVNQDLMCHSIKITGAKKDKKYDIFPDLLLRFKQNGSNSLSSQTMIVYKSGSKPNGDHFKTVEVSDACIFLVYPAWIGIKKFLTNLPEPEIFSEHSVCNVVQIGDRWYPINDDEAFSKSSVREIPKDDGKTDKMNETESFPSYQFRLLLNAPNINFMNTTKNNDENAVTVALRLSHFEFFYKMICLDDYKTQIFVHDLELFTNSIYNTQKYPPTDSTLLHPLNFALNMQTLGNNNIIKFASETVRARMTFNDMILVMNILLNIIENVNENEKNSIASSEDSYNINTNDETKTILEKKNSRDANMNVTKMSATFNGFTLLIEDDSLFHFATQQELIEFSMGIFEYDFEQQINTEKVRSHSTRIRLKSLKLLDCLQPCGSAFRVVANSGTLSNTDDTLVYASQLRDNEKSFEWADFRTRKDCEWGFESSKSMATLSENQFGNSMNEKDHQSIEMQNLDLIEIFHVGNEKKMDKIELLCRTLSFQWNPSTIIALKRFCSKLVKEFSNIMNSSSSIHMAEGNMNTTNVTNERIIMDKRVEKKLRASLRFEKVTLCLNKEHQYRRLLEITFSDTLILFEKDLANQIDVQGNVKDIIAIDPNLNTLNRVVIGALPKEHERKNLFSIRFRTFDKKVPQKIDNWVKKKMGDVDDYLSVQLFAIKYNYIRDRTSELIDYLSNGLPAAGIGATTRAAKGFLESRIKTRSAMQILVEGPVIIIPRHAYTDVGIKMRLGDIEIRSWYEEGIENDLAMKMSSDLFFENKKSCPNFARDKSKSVAKSDWWRCLSLVVRGMGRNTFLSNEIDFYLILQKPSWHSRKVCVQCWLTYVEAIIKYQDWVTFRAVINENIGKTVDESGWDNVGNKADEEDDIDDATSTSKVTSILSENISRSTPLAYVEGAQIIRYGHKNSGLKDDLKQLAVDETTSKPIFEFQFELDGLSLTLHRDDPIVMPTNVSNFSIGKNCGTNNTYQSIDYDVARLRVKRLSVGASSYASGDTSTYVKLYELDLYDLGDEGRNVRETVSSKLANLEFEDTFQRKPCLFMVLCEGYGTNEKEVESTDAPQLVFTFDLSPDNSPSVRVVIDYLSLNLIIRPFIEIFKFLSCDWSLKAIIDSSNPFDLQKDLLDTSKTTKASKFSRANCFWKNIDNNTNAFSEKEGRQGIQAKLVAHYPRIVFIADESDATTRALVLRGLAVINLALRREEVTVACNDQFESSIEGDSCTYDWSDIRTTTSLDAHLNSMESYINPNIGVSLGINVSSSHTSTTSIKIAQKHEYKNELGVALIEPVTATIEFNQIQRDLHPTSRSLSMSLNPVSTMLSFEDLTLIEAVLRRITKEGNRAAQDRYLEPNFDKISYEEIKVGSESENENILNNIEDHDWGDQPAKPMDLKLKEKISINAYLETNKKEYNVTFKNSELGLVLRKSGGDFKVEKVLTSDYDGLISIGDVMTSIEGRSISRLPFATVKQLLVKMTRPLNLTFKKIDRSKVSSLAQSSEQLQQINRNDVDSSVKIYSISFHSGMQNGLVFGRSHAGDIPMVTDIKEHQFRSSIIIFDEKKSNGSNHVYIPHPGAVILEVNEDSTLSMGFKKTMKFLNTLYKEEDDESNKSRRMQSTYTLTFLEATSSDWAYMDKVEIAIAGLKLTVIDDINGRDMPLLRGSLTDFDFYLRRGMGLKTFSIAVSPPSMFRIPKSLRSNPAKISLEKADLPVSDPSEIIIKIKTEVNSGLEYYNARIALWEPIIEPYWMQVQIEWQAGNHCTSKFRSGNLSFFVSDKIIKNDKRLWFNEEAKVNDTKQTKNTKNDNYVHINLTDAAMAMIIKTANELYEWRKVDRGEQVEQTAATVVMNWNEINFTPDKKSAMYEASIEDASKFPTTKISNLSTSGSSFINRCADLEKSSNKSNDEYEKKQILLNTSFLSQSSSPMKSPASTQLSKNAAAQKAAQVALQFARKRGASTQKQGNWAKPFILRNQTGVSIAFVQQTDKGHKLHAKDEKPTENFEETMFSYKKKEEKETIYNASFQDYDPSCICEVKNGCEAVFDLNIVYCSDSNFNESKNSDQTQASKGRKRIRDYDGHFPHLSVALHPSIGALKPLTDLSVVKVGRTLRKLNVTNFDSNNNRVNVSNNFVEFLTLVWTVELEKNRRILTLSSTVSISSSGCGMPVEVGYRHDYSPSDKNDKFVSNDSSLASEASLQKQTIRRGIISLGVAKPGNSFYLPIWLCVRGRTIIYIRPLGANEKNKYEYKYDDQNEGEDEDKDEDDETGSFYQWSVDGILEFTDGRNIVKEVKENKKFWKWRQIKSEYDSRNKMNLSKVSCNPSGMEASQYLQPAIFFCTGITERKKDSSLSAQYMKDNNGVKRSKMISSDNDSIDENEILCVTVGSSLSLRNLLPMGVDWEIATFSQSEADPTKYLDGSQMRKDQLKIFGCIPLASPDNSNCEQICEEVASTSNVSGNTKRRNYNEEKVLESGFGVEIYSCDVSNMTTYIRFRCKNPSSLWSEWVLMKYPYDDHNRCDDVSATSKGNVVGSDNSNTAYFHVHGHQLTVQSKCESNAPITFGVKIIPKNPFYPDFSSGIDTAIFGFDVILFADLWMRNMTSLNLTFGAPESQIYEMKKSSHAGKDTAAAEATLMDIASVLELGEKGKPLRSNDNFQSMYIGGEIFNLPLQNQSNEVYEEVFEYIEVEFSTVKQRWWASEQHDQIRPKPSLIVPDSSLFEWDDTFGWKIDCSGQTQTDTDGWESCVKLDDFHDGTLLSKRRLNPYHRYRRRRWFRRRVQKRNYQRKNEYHIGTDHRSVNDRYSPEELVMFHHPVLHNASENVKWNEMDESDLRDLAKRFVDTSKASPCQLPIRICIRCGDGRWSVPIVIPPSGIGHGIIRLYSSRWRCLLEQNTDSLKQNLIFQGLKSKSSHDLQSYHNQNPPDPKFAKGWLNPGAYDLSYRISNLNGPWGEVSRLLIISSRFLVQNDSKYYDFDIKQVGAPLSSIIRVGVGEVFPFYWTDIRLPELVCVRPVPTYSCTSKSHKEVEKENMYVWSGGFDLNSIGMISLRVRYLEEANSANKEKLLRTVRAHVEIRKGTDGTGITLSLREEAPSGKGSLFRIENFSPFPFWIAQDGVLSNPKSRMQAQFQDNTSASTKLHADGYAQNEAIRIGESVESDFSVSEMKDGEMIAPMDCVAFGLDVPFRQGKYAHRSASSMAELLMLRISLAPLSSREGVESTKVINLTKVGDNVRLNPTKLTYMLEDDIITGMLGVRILAVVCADGPTRVVRVCAVEKEMTASGAIGNVVRRHAKQSEAYLEKLSDKHGVKSTQTREEKQLRKIINNAAEEIMTLIKKGHLMNEKVAIKSALKKEGVFDQDLKVANISKIRAESFDNMDACTQIDVEQRKLEKKMMADTNFVVRSSFQGFVISIIDAVPSEIAVLTLKSVDFMSKWNALRTIDASIILTICWLQLDNHCPNAPYPVALCPIEKRADHDDQGKHLNFLPFLSVGITIAPQHSSGIPCLRSITVAPRDVAISLDLAFIMRVQKFFLNIHDYLSESQDTANYVGIISKEDVTYSDLNSSWCFPDLLKSLRVKEEHTAENITTQKLYFESLTIMPFFVSLSVAQTRALTKAQAILEGHEAAAVHAAVRKGDLLLGDGVGVLGVKIGSRNATPLAIIRGVCKSILVDALLRCDAASLNFPGVAIRNHITSTPQLTTYLTAHYLTALRRNVPSLLGSLSAFGNPIGLIRELGDGVSDFVSEPIRGLKKSVEELDPTLFVDGVARGTGSLARHAVGGFADTASLLTDTLSKNMAVLTLDRKYAQKRDRDQIDTDIDGSKKTFVHGVGSGGIKLVQGLFDGVTGVVRAPMRGAEKKGMEGFAKGVGKGLLGLVVKPVIGISDAATDVMVGVKGSVEGRNGDDHRYLRCIQLRPRRAFYGTERALRCYQLEDASASNLMIKTRLAGDFYVDHCFVGNRIILIGVKRFVLLGQDGRDQMIIKLSQIKKLEMRNVPKPDGDFEWGIVIFLRTPKNSGSEVKTINCGDKQTALQLQAILSKSMN